MVHLQARAYLQKLLIRSLYFISTGRDDFSPSVTIKGRNLSLCRCSVSSELLWANDKLDSLVHLT